MMRHFKHKKNKRKKSPTAKGDAQRDHAKRRFMERYGFEFNRHLRREFVKLIQDNQCHLVRKQSNRVSVWDLIYEGNVFRVVYDKQRKNIVTVLPDDKSPGSPTAEAAVSKAV